MCLADSWQMILKDGRGVTDGHGNNRTVSSGGNLKAAFMKREKFRLIIPFIPGSLRENTYGNSGFYLFNGFADDLKSLFDIFAVQKETVQVPHPVRQKGNAVHLIFCHIAGGTFAPGVGQQDIIEAAVVSDIEHGRILRNIFFSNYSDFHTGNFQTEVESAGS